MAGAPSARTERQNVLERHTLRVGRLRRASSQVLTLAGLQQVQLVTGPHWAECTSVCIHFLPVLLADCHTANCRRFYLSFLCRETR